ncbi:unnamed protein product [Hermetia illucens]|uniref:Uncharacterized protein n=1 Tax=Hermetia illucens TaxID=343691 RepID=A0A7R8YYV1_HERIL|nr:unnamed protein product [Hermetia illucens]
MLSVQLESSSSSSQSIQQSIYNPINRMNFTKLFVVFAVVLIAFSGQSEAGWWKRVFKPVERLGQRVRDAGIQGLEIAQQGANVLATVRGGPPQQG